MTLNTIIHQSHNIVKGKQEISPEKVDTYSTKPEQPQTRKPTRAEQLYKDFTEMFPDMISGAHTYERYGNAGDANEPLSVEHLGGNTYGFMTFYMQNGDLMPTTHHRF